MTPEYRAQIRELLESETHLDDDTRARLVEASREPTELAVAMDALGQALRDTTAYRWMLWVLERPSRIAVVATVYVLILALAIWLT